MTIILIILFFFQGCVVFTSSVAGYIPNPFASMYGATKAFVSQFAACINVECKSQGIDICAVHPSPVASNFYSRAEHKIEMMEAAAKSAVAPSTLPREIFRSVGRCVWRDLGAMAFWVEFAPFFPLFVYVCL